MMTIKQFRYNSDNFGYIVCGHKEAVVIDGGAWREISLFLKTSNLRPVLITNTHRHHDHISGNDHLLEIFSSRYLNPSEAEDHATLTIEAETIRVYKTPGHTDDSICFHAGDILVTGDTLFNGTVGNCFSGNLKNFYHSIKRILSLPDETKIYAGHDYVLNSLAFAQYLEPNNPDLETYRDAYHERVKRTLFSTLAEEKKINPYLRFNQEAIIKILKERNLPHDTEWQRWESLMSID
jgi:hydroxyacylglutathione hydrolase